MGNVQRPRRRFPHPHDHQSCSAVAMSDAQTLDDVAALKTALRVVARARRAAVSGDEGSRAAERLCAHLLSLDLPEGPVAGYWPLGDEIDIRPALRELRRRGREVGLPITGPLGTPLTFRRWSEDAPLLHGRFGTCVPDPGCPDVAPRVVLVPLLAFDRRGNRIGHGGGYYDRTLAQLGKAGDLLAIGVAYAVQEFDTLPSAAFDYPLDRIVTDKEIIQPAG